MYNVGLDGEIYFEKFNFLEERIDLITNPLLAQYLRYPDLLQEDALVYRKAIELASYSLNQNKRYDLDVRERGLNLELFNVQANYSNGLASCYIFSCYVLHDC